MIIPAMSSGEASNTWTSTIARWRSVGASG